jgi:dienelactone hydrolase
VQWLATEGYVALVVDSFTPRGVSTDSGGLTGERVCDAFGALAYLRSLAFVESNRIGAMGWSLGGGVALLASGEMFADHAPAPGSFRAVVAFYPACALTDAAEIKVRFCSCSQPGTPGLRRSGACGLRTGWRSVANP